MNKRKIILSLWVIVLLIVFSALVNRLFTKEEVTVDTFIKYLEEGGDNTSGMSLQEKAAITTFEQSKGEFVERTQSNAKRDLPLKEKELENLKSKLVVLPDEATGQLIYRHASAPKPTSHFFSLIIAGHDDDYGLYAEIAYIGADRLFVNNYKITSNKLEFEVPINPKYLIQNHEGAEALEYSNFKLDARTTYMFELALKANQLEILLEGDENNYGQAVSEAELQAAKEVYEVYTAMNRVKYLKELSR